MTLSEIKEQLFIRANVFLSISTISRKLKLLNITPKRLSLILAERNRQDKIDKRAEYAMEVAGFSLENLIF
jgi:hypothetical protein